LVGCSWFLLIIIHYSLKIKISRTATIIP